jgi:hypothetical protein
VDAFDNRLRLRRHFASRKGQAGRLYQDNGATNLGWGEGLAIVSEVSFGQICVLFSFSLAMLPV